MAGKLDEILRGIEARKTISSRDIVDLRRNIFGDDHVCREEADRLFHLNDTIADKAPGWADFFVAAMSNKLLRQTRPIGYVTQDDADWLVSRISKDGHVEGETEFRTLFRVLNEAMDATETLVDFALDEVKAAVIEGAGYIGRNRRSAAGQVSLDDVKMIEKVLYASGGDGNIRVTEKEAEILFDINDSCEAEPDAADSWTSLFINAVTNSIMYYSPFKTATREEMAQAEAWLHGQQSLVQGMMGRPDIKGAFAEFFGFTARQDRKAFEAQQKAHAEATAKEEKIVEYEARWLTNRLSRDGVLNENEKTLLRHIAKMCPNIHHSLQPFIKAAA